MIRFFVVVKKRKVWSGNIFAESEQALRDHLSSNGYNIRRLRKCHSVS